MISAPVDIAPANMSERIVAIAVVIMFLCGLYCMFAKAIARVKASFADGLMCILSLVGPKRLALFDGGCFVSISHLEGKCDGFGGGCICGS